MLPALKKLKCDHCKQKLVFNNEELIVEDNYVLIRNVTHYLMMNYILFDKILINFEENVLLIHDKRRFLINFVTQYLTQQGHLINFYGCQYHSEQTIVKIIINSARNTLLKNYCGKKYCIKI